MRSIEKLVFKVILILNLKFFRRERILRTPDYFDYLKTKADTQNPVLYVLQQAICRKFVYLLTIFISRLWFKIRIWISRHNEQSFYWTVLVISSLLSSTCTASLYTFPGNKERGFCKFLFIVFLNILYGFKYIDH